MKFLALLAALLAEQALPLREGNRMQDAFARYARYLEVQLDGGQYRHGAIAWVLAVVPVATAAGAIGWLLADAGAMFALAWSAAVLYATMGFRRFSHAYAEIQDALRAGELDAARERLGRWRGESASEFSPGETARVTIEQGLIASHRQVFGTLFWFAALGPAGAVLYRAGALLAGEWRTRAGPEAGEFASFAARAFHWIDWLPARMTASAFAIVGDFEDAIYCWRTQAAAWNPGADGVILASGAGALGLRLGEPLHQNGSLQLRPGLGTGDEADVDYMTSAIGLVWRALVLWMVVVLLVTVAYALG